MSEEYYFRIIEMKVEMKVEMFKIKMLIKGTVKEK